MPDAAATAGSGDLKPSAWVQRFASLVPGSQARGVLDIACGSGRHTKLFLDAGHHVVAVDHDTSGVKDLASRLNLEITEADLETASGWPFANEEFAGVVVTNYLYRPILDDIVSAVAPGGALIYETFAAGNEQFGRPKNPNFLLREGELIDTVKDRLTVVAYEHGEIRAPRRAMIQRIAAVRSKRDQSHPRLDSDY
jgi:SAM-dependent methyltransferase